MSSQLIPKQNMKALKSFRYGRKDLVAGDGFQAEPSHARLLSAIGRALLDEKVVQKEKPEQAPTKPKETELEKVEVTKKKPASTKKAETKKKTGQGQYQRRDLRAED